MDRVVVSNFRVFYKIASEAFDAMNIHSQENTRPKPGNEGSYIKTYDPQQKCFKNAITTIVLTGICLESFLHLINVERNGVETAKKFDSGIYENKLKTLGCNNQGILDMCTNYRASRKEIVHEKAFLDDGNIKTAQKEAKLAIAMLHRIFEHFNIKMG